ncbi:MAG: ABC transporter substrate-binding protein [Bacteroidota bacterium]|nr:ABC transporter substrate-binding protein [Bacteroidota bacterium]
MYSKSNLILLSILSVLFFISPAYAQNNEFIRQFNLGKEQFNLSKYNESTAIFSELIKKYPANDQMPVVHYYLALSYYRNQSYKDANFVLYLLISKYPNWKDLSLAYYLKAIVQFDSNNQIDALTLLNKITDPQIQLIADQAKANYLDKLTTDNIDYLTERFPYDRVLQQMRTNRQALTIQKEIKVALLLPYELAFKNNFIAELYLGIQLAADSLNKRGSKLKLYPFDSGKDTTKVLEFVNDTNSKNFDLVIGPLFAVQQPIISRFSKDKNVIVINPLSNNAFNSLFNPNYFLWKPGYETMGRNSADFAFQNFTRKSNCVIIYGNELADSLIAKAYRSEYEAIGGNVLLFRKLPKEISNYFGPIMNKLFPVIDTVGHVFVSSSDPTLAANIYTYFETVLVERTATYKDTRSDEERKKEEEDKKKKEDLLGPKLTAKDIPIIAPASWLDFASISPGQFALHNTHFIAPDYIMRDSVPNASFYYNYFDKMGLPPSSYAYLGYDLMLFYGKNLLNQPNNITSNTIRDAKLQKAYAYSYIWYNGQNDNAFVPIVKIEDYKLILANPPK